MRTTFVLIQIFFIVIHLFLPLSLQVELFKLCCHILSTGVGEGVGGEGVTVQVVFRNTHRK